MGILKKLLMFIIVLIALLAIIGFFLPSTAHVERSTEIATPICTVHTLVNGYGSFNEWSPWAQIDPNAQYTYEGPDFGVGAKMSWTSEDRNVGSGSQEIVETNPSDSVKIKLDFGPDGQADAFYRLSSQGDATAITWGFDTEFGGNLIGRYFGLFFDSMIGKDYEKGLQGLKAKAESLPQADWCDLEAETTESAARPIAYVSGQSGRAPEEVQAAFADSYGQVMGFLGKHKLQPGGAPIAINKAWSEEEGYVFDAGMPLSSAPEVELDEDSAVQIGETYAGSALKVTHKGSYAEMEASFDKADAYLAAHGLEQTSPSWTEFVSDPGSTPEEELITHIYIPIG